MTADAKWWAIVAEVERIHATGQPLLIGTRSVSSSERLGQWLAERGLAAKVLNATRLEEEAEIISLAGNSGRVFCAQTCGSSRRFPFPGRIPFRSELRNQTAP